MRRRGFDIKRRVMRGIWRFIEPRRDYGNVCDAYVAWGNWMVKTRGAWCLFWSRGQLGLGWHFFIL